MGGVTLTPRAQEIRRDLEKFRRESRLAANDYMLDWIATEIDKDEVGGYWLWDEPKKPRKKKAEVAAE